MQQRKPGLTIAAILLLLLAANNGWIDSLKPEPPGTPVSFGDSIAMILHEVTDGKFDETEAQELLDAFVGKGYGRIYDKEVPTVKNDPRLHELATLAKPQSPCIAYAKSGQAYIKPITDIESIKAAIADWSVK